MAGGANPQVRVGPELERLLQLPILIVMATKRADGSIQLNPIWFQFRDGDIWVNSNTRRSWPKNLQRDKEATLLLVDPREPERYAQIRSRLAGVIADPHHEVIDRLAERYTGKRFRELEPGEERISFKLEPVAVSGQML
jgi:PPOX class probable F420-dependent enzyme